MHDTPENVILTKDEYGNGRGKKWHYHLVIVLINYLYGKTRPAILFSVHQCAKYSIDPKKNMKKLSKGLDAI